jgi:LPXTG-site transpeptidase (sortase) family protein
VLAPRAPRRWADPRAIGLIVVVVATIVVAVTLLSGPAATSPGAAVASPVTSATSLVHPTPLASPSATTAGSSTHPSPGRSGTVAVRVAIPRLGIDLPIVEGDGMAAPMDRAAHFPGTAWPDAGSNTYLYAHAQEGMFVRLWEAKVGDEVRLTLVNAQKRCFRVTEVVPVVAWNDTSFLMPTSGERLTLQTSTSYTPTAPRFVVIALPCR